MLNIVVLLFGNIPQLIKDVSGEYDQVPVDLVDILEESKDRYIYYSSYVGAIKLIFAACERVDPNMSDMKKNLCFQQFKDIVTTSTKEALRYYNKHVQENIHFYSRRFNFSIYKQPSDQFQKVLYPKEFFTNFDRDINLELLNIHYNEYKLIWKSTLRDSYTILERI